MSRTIYRNRRLLNLAHKVHNCKFNLLGCEGYSVDGCEPAHSDQSAHGKGMGIKASDDQHVASCHSCHLFYGAGKMPREKAVELFNQARLRTFLYYEGCGWLDKVGYSAFEVAIS